MAREACNLQKKRNETNTMQTTKNISTQANACIVHESCWMNTTA